MCESNKTVELKIGEKIIIGNFEIILRDVVVSPSRKGKFVRIQIKNLDLSLVDKSK